MPLKDPEFVVLKQGVAAVYAFGVVPPHGPEKLDVVSDNIAESSPLSGLGTGEA